MLADQLAEAVQHIEGQYVEVEVETPDVADAEVERKTLPADPDVKNFSYAVVDGEVYYRENSIMTQVELSDNAKARVTGMVELRQIVNQLIQEQLDDYPDEDIKATQAKLNTAYDAFTAKYGLLNDRKNGRLFEDDSSYYLLCSLENLDENKQLKSKADMFTKRTIRSERTVTSVVGKDESKKDRLSTVLYNLVESITIGASLLEAFMPETTEKILAQLNTTKRPLDEMDTFGKYISGTKVTDKPEILFMRLDPKEVLAQAEEIKKKQMAEAKAESGVNTDEQDEKSIDIEAKPEIEFDDFMKMQFQVGEIIACEEVKKSKKLLCSQVKIGSEVKQIVSGIKKYYSAEEMVGKKVMVLVNLKPAKLAGVLSEGMLLCAEDAEGNLALMTPEKAMPAGAEIC